MSSGFFEEVATGGLVIFAGFVVGAIAGFLGGENVSNGDLPVSIAGGGVLDAVAGAVVVVGLVAGGVALTAGGVALAVGGFGLAAGGVALLLPVADGVVGARTTLEDWSLSSTLE
jgi:hypothetical protein